MLMGVAALLPLMLIGIVPLLTGDLPRENFVPLVPLGHDAAGAPIDGAWDKAGWILFIGGLFIAAWSTYGFETAVCYTREFKDPKRDTFKAIFYSGLMCLAVFILVPLSFQGALGLTGMLAPDIYSGMGVGKAMAGMLGGGAFIETFVAILLIFALMLTIMTAMAGSSRTLYQASVDGWLPRYLSHVNEHGRAHAGDVDGSDVQSDPAHDVGLSVHPGGVQRRLHHLQLPQPQRGLDPSYGPAATGNGLTARRRS